ncbi:MAG: ribosome biogenesis factor YjgA [Myxococcota bacterium]|nr:ribosome biogenesis factor YjgA [Myxococcota bacterium]
MTQPEDPKREAQSEDRPAPVSRTQQRQEALAISQLGLELLALSPGALDQLELPSEIREAIALCRRLKLRAQSRQKRLIAQLLRAEDHDAIRAKVERLGTARFEDIARNKEDELWCTRLLAEGDPALQEFMEVCPHADRQQIRTWVRTAQQEESERKKERAKARLLRLISSARS